MPGTGGSPDAAIAPRPASRSSTTAIVVAVDLLGCDHVPRLVGKVERGEYTTTILIHCARVVSDVRSEVERVERRRTHAAGAFR